MVASAIFYHNKWVVKDSHSMITATTLNSISWDKYIAVAIVPCEQPLNVN